MLKAKKLILSILALLAFATPAAAQVSSYASEGEKFLEHVRKFEAEDAMGMLRRPGNNLVDYRGRAGEAALHIAVKGRKLTWVDAIVGFNANLDIQDNDGNTPLMIAVKMGQADVVGRLLGYGADVNRANRRGETPAILAVHARNDAILEALLRSGANPDAADSLAGLSARQYAARETRNPRLLELIETTGKQDQFQFGPVLR